MSLAQTSSAAIFKWHFAQKITFFSLHLSLTQELDSGISGQEKKMWKLFKQFFIVKLTKRVTMSVEKSVSKVHYPVLLSIVHYVKGRWGKKVFLHRMSCICTARHVIIGAKLCCRNLVFVINDPREKRFLTSRIQHSDIPSNCGFKDNATWSRGHDFFL